MVLAAGILALSGASQAASPREPAACREVRSGGRGFLERVVPARLQRALHPKLRRLLVPRAVRQLLRRLPKSELHAHIAGSTPRWTVARFSLENGHHPLRVLWDTLTLDAQHTYGSLESYLDKYYRICKVVTPDQFRRATAAVIRHAAVKDNVRFLELRTAVNSRSEGTPDKIIDAIEQGIEEGQAWVQQHVGVRMHVGLIIAAVRNSSPEESYQAAQIAIRRVKRSGSLVSGVDLAGDEAAPGGQVDNHAAALQLVREHNAGAPAAKCLGITLHAGEVARSSELSGAESVARSVGYGATRIGHATYAVGDDGVMKLLGQKGIHVEACPRSNVQTGSIEDLAAHPLRRFLDAGLDVSLSTDNRMMSGTLTNQLIDLYLAGQLRSWAELKALTRNGINAGFASPAIRKEVIAGVEREFQEIERDPKLRRVIERYLNP